MPRYYLVRRNLETFIGPMTVKDLAQAYKRMEFGLQDEVSGHCGKWIAFEDVGKIKRHYPELQPVVSEVMLGGWGISGHGEQQIGKKRKSKQKSKSWLARTLVAIAVIAGAGGVFIYDREDLVLQFFAYSRPSPKQANDLFSGDDPIQFQQFMVKNLKTIRNESMKNKPSYFAWLPHLRSFAYRNDGSIDGFPLKMLRGLEKIQAPIDCTISRWRNRWRGAAPELDVAGRGEKAGRKSWLRLVSWDPNWINSRSYAYWSEPKSYFHFCVKLSREAYLGLVSDQQLGSSFKASEPITKRLDALNYILNGSPKELSPFNTPSPLAELSCLDVVTKLDEIDQCISVESNYKTEWTNLIKFRYKLNKMKLIAQSSSLGPLEISNRLNGLITDIGSIDPFTGLDYSLELKFYRMIIFLRGDVDAAIKKMKVDAPNFTPKPQ